MRIGKSRLHSLGSDGLVAVPEGVAACEIAVPPGPHINGAIDELATARVDENLIAMSSQCGGMQFYPSSQGYPISGWLAIDQPQDHAQRHADEPDEFAEIRVILPRAAALLP